MFQVKNFVLFGDIHKSIYFLCWKEEGAQLVLLAKDFGSLDCYATEFLIDGTTLSLLVSDSRKNIKVTLIDVSSFSVSDILPWLGAVGNLNCFGFSLPTKKPLIFQSIHLKENPECP